MKEEYFDKELLSLNKAAKYLNVSPSTLRNWDKSGKLKAVRTPGGHRRYDIKDLSPFLQIKGPPFLKKRTRVLIYHYISSAKDTNEISKEIKNMLDYAYRKDMEVTSIILETYHSLGHRKEDTRQRFFNLIEMIKRNRIDLVLVEKSDILHKAKLKLLEKIVPAFNASVKTLRKERGKKEGAGEEEATPTLESVEDLELLLTLSASSPYIGEAIKLLNQFLPILKKDRE